MFALWYLREKGLVSQTEHSDYVIAGAGVDYVEEHLPRNQTLYQLLKAAETGTPGDVAPSAWTTAGEAPAPQSADH